MNERFIKNSEGRLLEGPLSSQEPKLLIIMKEPHGEKLDCFWMRKVLDGEREKWGKVYFNVLGGFAKKILNEANHTEALKKSAYINLFPHYGEASVGRGSGYSILLNLNKEKWKLPQKEPILIDAEFGDDYNQLLQNRLQIIAAALEQGLPVLAEKSIAPKIAECFDLKRQENYAGEYLRYQGDKGTVYAVPHPIRKSYQKLGKALGWKTIEDKNI